MLTCLFASFVEPEPLPGKEHGYVLVPVRGSYADDGSVPVGAATFRKRQSSDIVPFSAGSGGVDFCMQILPYFVASRVDAVPPGVVLVSSDHRTARRG